MPRPLQPLERCVRDVVRRAPGIPTLELISHVALLMEASDHEIRRAAEHLIDRGDLQHRVDFSLEACR